MNYTFTQENNLQRGLQLLPQTEPEGTGRWGNSTAVFFWLCITDMLNFSSATLKKRKVLLTFR